MVIYNASGFTKISYHTIATTDPSYMAVPSSFRGCGNPISHLVENHIFGSFKFLLV